MDDFHVSGILETWKRPVLQAWVCGNLHESRQRGDHTAHLDGVFEAISVALSVRVIAHNVGQAQSAEHRAHPLHASPYRLRQFAWT